MSDLYHREVKVVDASQNRVVGAITDDSKNPLQVVYRKYSAAAKCDSNQTPLNWVFLCGNGMNKGIWNYHIDALYKHYLKTNTPVKTVLALDYVCQGDLYAINGLRLGYATSWLDFAKDVQLVLKGEMGNFVGQNQTNILVGHSMGGFTLLMVSFVMPYLFQSVVVYNPVVYTTPAINEMLKQGLEAMQGIGVMRDTFEVDNVFLDAKPTAHPGALECGPIHPDVIKHFRTNSFFKKFDDKVLRDMIADDLMIFPSGEGSKGILKLKSTEMYQMSCYVSSFHSVAEGMKLYNSIQAKVFFIHSERDVLLPEGVQFLKELLPHCTYITTLGVHLDHGINPELFLSHLYEIAEKTTLEEGHYDSDIQLQESSDIRSREAVSQAKFKEILSKL